MNRAFVEHKVKWIICLSVQKNYEWNLYFQFCAIILSTVPLTTYKNVHDVQQQQEKERASECE